MNFQEFKTQLSADLWEEFSESYYVYESDDPKAIDNVKEHITTLIEGIRVMEDSISEEEADKLINNNVSFIFKSQLDDLSQDDLGYWGELFWFDLISWANKDHYWYDREKGGVYDDNIEGGLYSK